MRNHLLRALAYALVAANMPFPVAPPQGMAMIANAPFPDRAARPWRPGKSGVAAARRAARKRRNKQRSPHVR